MCGLPFLSWLFRLQIWQWQLALTVLHFGMSRNKDVRINVELSGKIMKSSDEFKTFCTVLHYYLEGGVTTTCVVLKSRI